MAKNIFVFLICLIQQVPVQSQTANPSSYVVISVYEASVLALLVLISLLCMAIMTGVFVLLRKFDKILMNVSEKEPVLEYRNHRAMQHISDTATTWWVGSDTTPTDSRTPTRPSSLKLPTNQSEEPFQSPSNRSISLSAVRPKPPPDYNDTMSRMGRQSRVPGAASPLSVRDRSSSDCQSHYMEMKSCTIGAFSSGPGEEAVYDTPRCSFSSRRSCVPLPPPSRGAAKHSRIHSDPSRCSPSPAEQAVEHPGNSRPGSGSFNTQPLRSDCVTDPVSAGVSSPKHKPKASVRGPKQSPVDI
ncbi:hypothetical protein MATL_G00192540 [Megalops atlanticus]|uniref:Uncharacterized protein n=1 Tax=Megalops atlanticus TaxID=7932 RepID=A0A9D3T4R9_MEGAT|nr:hypothetical protein MATL_G00192540 [Megalops atlanticus]